MYLGGPLNNPKDGHLLSPLACGIQFIELSAAVSRIKSPTLLIR